MLSTMIDFTNVLLAALLVGAMFGVWLFLNPAGGSDAVLYVALQQQGIRGLDTTRFLNQPIDAIVMTWQRDAPPANWMRLRDEWWPWHLIRLAAGLGGLSLLIAATLKRGWVG